MLAAVIDSAAQSVPSEPLGVADPGRLDEVVVTGTGLAELRLVPGPSWVDDAHGRLLLREKLFNYVAYVTDGDLVRNHPTSTAWKLVLRWPARPSDPTMTLLAEAGKAVKEAGGSLELRITSPVGAALP